MSTNKNFITMITATQVVCTLLVSPLVFLSIYLYFKMIGVILDEFKEIITKNK